MAENSYFIQSVGGMSMGMWEAPTPQDALLQFYRKRGYTEDQVWMDGAELAFSKDIADDFSDSPNTWLLEQIN
tara:strand:- start:908 stop:1126 length:219 start_codon:yes stop_codon:yes gene_type:complete